MHPPVDRLRNEQRRLLAAADRLDALVADPHPGGMEALANARWMFTRDMLLHFANLESTVLQPLMQDVRAEAANCAWRSSEDLRSVYDQFRRHGARWRGLPPVESWDEYRRAIGLLTRRIRVRVAAQESTVFPLLPARPGSRVSPRPDPIDYVAEAWKVRDIIYSGTTPLV